VRRCARLTLARVCTAAADGARRLPPSVKSSFAERRPSLLNDHRRADPYGRASTILFYATATGPPPTPSSIVIVSKIICVSYFFFFSARVTRVHRFFSSSTRNAFPPATTRLPAVSVTYHVSDRVVFGLVRGPFPGV
jgi:hypothetical protein